VKKGRNKCRRRCTPHKVKKKKKKRENKNPKSKHKYIKKKEGAACW
jgi:hypothetical protein